MSDETKLVAQKRESNGTGAARRLRHTGQVPAIIYSNKGETLTIQVDAHQFGLLLRDHGESMILTLNVADAGDKTALLKEVQYHPVSGAIIHADFLEVSLTEKITAPVVVEIIGDCNGVKLGGILEHQLSEIEVEALPMDLPESIPVDVTELAIGDHVCVGDLDLGDKVVALTDASVVIASVAVPRVAEEEDAAAEGEAAEGAEPEVVGAEEKASDDEA